MRRSYMIHRRIQQLYRAFCFVSQVASRPTRIGGAARLAPNAARWPAIGTPASVHIPTCSVQHKTFGGCDHSQSWRADSAEQLERHSLARDASSQSPSHIGGSIDAATSKTPASCLTYRTPPAPILPKNLEKSRKSAIAKKRRSRVPYFAWLRTALPLARCNKPAPAAGNVLLRRVFKED